MDKKNKTKNIERNKFDKKNNRTEMPQNEKIEAWMGKHITKFFYVGLCITAFLSLLLFDVKVSIAGDDSGYVLRAYNLLHNFSFPSYQGPLYPILLTPLIALFGINIPMLKCFSLVCILAAYLFFYKAFKDKIPNLLMAIVLLLVAFCSNIAYYAGQTFSEAAFLFFQALFFYWFVRLFIQNPDRPSIKSHLILGLLVLLLGLTRTAGLFAIPAILLYFMVYGQWKDAGYSFVSIFSFQILFSLLKKLIWKGDTVQFSTQLSALIAKDAYNPAAGNEDFAGYIARLGGNAVQYFDHIFRFMGIEDNVASEPSPFAAVFFITAFIIALVVCYKKHKTLFFTTLYAGSMCFLTFLSLQVFWNQDRLIVVFYPFILPALFAAVYYLHKASATGWIVLASGVILLFLSMGVAVKDVKQNKTYRSELLKGNPLYGFSPDWENYIKMSQWIGENLPDDGVLVACRKAEISQIYGNRIFYPIYSVPKITCDSLLNRMEQEKFTLIGIDMSAIETNKELDDFRLQNKQAIIGVLEHQGYPVLLFNKEKCARNESISSTLPDVAAYIKENKNNGLSVADIDMLYNNFKESKVGYVMKASLRLNPNQNTGNIISTVHRYMYYVSRKYPGIEGGTVHIEGKSEPTALIKLVYAE